MVATVLKPVHLIMSSAGLKRCLESIPADERSQLFYSEGASLEPDFAMLLTQAKQCHDCVLLDEAGVSLLCQALEHSQSVTWY